jgi:hypothetical protein
MGNNWSEVELDRLSIEIEKQQMNESKILKMIYGGSWFLRIIP